MRSSLQLLRLSSLSLLLLLTGLKAAAQLAPAEDFFNSGAQFYISNNIPQAKEMTEMGLKLYPQDEKLKKLEQLLNQQQQQQQQQQQDQQQSQQQKSDSQKNQQQQKQQQKSQDQQKQDEEKQKQQEQQKAGQQKQPDQQNEADKKPDSDKKDADKNDEDQAGQAKPMTPDEAKRLLDAQKDNEQILPLKPADKPRDPLRPVKDW